MASTFSGPEIASADAPAVLYPGGGGPSLIRPPYEVGSWTPSFPLTTKLGKQRILGTKLSPLNQIALPFSEQELYYPSFLFGSWQLTATLKSKRYPFGQDVVPSTSLLEGSPRNRDERVGDSTSYEVHYFSTQADVASRDVVTVDLSAKPKIIADRAFNAISLSKGYKQLTPVQDVDWDYRKDPTQLTLRFQAGAVAEDMRPLGQRRAEVYITARSSEEAVDNENGRPIFCAAERTRAVTLAPGNVIVNDSEVITEYTKVDDDHVTAISRIAAYLTPNPNSREGVLWEQIGGKAYAFFDYEWQMTRLAESSHSNASPDGTTTEHACVKTPNGTTQCAK